MAPKTRVAILMGGKSSEHEVSLQSAKNVIKAVDRDRFEPVLIGISKQGEWFLMDEADYLLNADDPAKIALSPNGKPLSIIPGAGKKSFTLTETGESIGPIDAAFPVLHGTYGEDGAIQGLLKIAGIPFVGAGVLGSAVGMDKEVMKRLLTEAGIPNAKYRTFYRHRQEDIDFFMVREKLGLPLFIKPACQGSSVGVSKASNEEEFRAAITNAFRYDSKLIVEEAVKGREIECSVIGNETPDASVPGEVITNTEKHGFYSYEAKYLDEHGAVLKIPAELDETVSKNIRDISLKAYRALFCRGMARLDSFLKEDGTILVNEINTLPGFTAISMYPKLWGATGKPYTALITELIELGLSESN
jgi:D-alanine-D-alanine ligase